MKLTAIAPSPTADAQCLTDPLRTSPAGNTPGRLVSRNNQHLTTCDRSPGHERGASRQRVHVAREFPGLVNRHLARGDIVFGWHLPVIANLSRCDGSWPRLLEFPVQRRGADAQFFRRLGAVDS